MAKLLILTTLLAGFTAFGAPSLQGSWILSESTMTYHVTHLLRKTEGTSHSAKGKGQCEKNGNCEFLIGVPVKTFESGNSNRDLHMLEVVKGAAYPMIVAHIKTHNNAATVDVEFAGVKQKLEIQDIQIVAQKEKSLHARFEIPLHLSEFKIERPSLVTVPIEDNVPVSIDAIWTKP
jgi:hypothetical protein